MLKPLRNQHVVCKTNKTLNKCQTFCKGLWHALCNEEIIWTSKRVNSAHNKFRSHVLSLYSAEPYANRFHTYPHLVLVFSIFARILFHTLQYEKYYLLMYWRVSKSFPAQAVSGGSSSPDSTVQLKKHTTWGFIRQLVFGDCCRTRP